MRKRKMEKFAGKLSLSIRYGIGSARAPCPCPPSAEPRGFCPGFAALLFELVQLLLQIGSLLLKLLDLRIAVSDVGHAVLPAARDVDAGRAILLDVLSQLSPQPVDFGQLLKDWLRLAAPVGFAVLRVFGVFGVFGLAGLRLILLVVFGAHNGNAASQARKVNFGEDIAFCRGSFRLFDFARGFGHGSLLLLAPGCILR